MIDLKQFIAKLEDVLREGRDMLRCREALDILCRWQWDNDLDNASRDTARRLVCQFRGRF